MTCLSELIDALKEIKFEAIPLEVVNKTKDVFIDYLGVLFSGSSKSNSQRIIESFEKNNILDRTEDLAFWLGSSARLIDLDDGHRFAMGHPGVVVNSTVLAAVANSQTNVDGKKVIEAIVKGYEVYCYQGRVINPSAYIKRGFDATSVCGGAAAAAAAGTIMGLDDSQMKDAVSLAASLCGGLNQSAIDGSSQKYFVAGWAAKLGIFSANIAKYGMGGPIGVFEGRLGYFNAFSSEPNLEYAHKKGIDWDIQNVYTKKYSCVRRIHPTLDAVTKIIDEEKVKIEEIATINVYGGEFLVEASNAAPKDMVQGQTSIPYTVSLLLNFGEVTEELIVENIKNEAILKFSKKINIIKDEEFVELARKDKSLWSAAKVEISTKDNKKYDQTVIYPEGEKENPFEKDAVDSKFLKLASEVIKREDAQRVVEDINELEKNQEVDKLFKKIIKYMNNY